jgi:NAD(P)-dependent dehydrogenase (short-subunit alcohol dehydrogenase family)
MVGDLSGARCLVTGAGRGAGLGIALALAAQGARVAVCDLDEEAAGRAAREVDERGGGGLALRADVSSEEEVRRAFAVALDAFDGIDLLVNTVAWIDPPGPVATMPYERWQTGVRINLDSVFLSSREALEPMRRQRSGSIVNISSLNGTRGMPNRAVYAATKSAILNLTETLALENREFGIRVNCVVPGGIVDSERSLILRELARQQGIPFRADWPDFDPPPRFVTPAEIGALVVFLAGPGGAAINGQSIRIGEAPRGGLQALL